MCFTFTNRFFCTVRMEEHKEAVSKGETRKSKLAENVWSANGDHITLWNEIKIIDRERF